MDDGLSAFEEISRTTEGEEESVKGGESQSKGAHASDVQPGDARVSDTHSSVICQNFSSLAITTID